MNDLDKLSAFLALTKAEPATALYVERALANTYDRFIKILYQDVDRIISLFQTRKQTYHDASEDTISMTLADQLLTLGYNATHDTKNGGHMDLHIKSKRQDFLWIGEAKRDYGPAWIAEGMMQLTRRYSDGAKGRTHGGLLLYIQNKNAKKIFADWRKAPADECIYDDLVTSDCPINPDLAFMSVHTHDTSGLDYTIRHMGVALFHEPLK